MRNIRYLLIGLIILNICCGPKPDNTKEIHGIKMVRISKVKFIMGNQYSKTIDDKPVREKEVNGFYISAAEIINSQYAAFLNEAVASNKIVIQEEKSTLQKTIVGNAGVCSGKHLAFWINSRGAEDRPSWLTYENNRFGVVPGKENLPVIAVTWYGAYAFAEHYGLRLPTEAEWECAARSGRNFALGTRTGRADVFGKFYNYNNMKGEPTDIGSYPPNPFGLYDLSGNVREWCLDRYEVNYYPRSPEKNPFNKVNPELPDDRVVRGGAFDSQSSECMSSSRDHLSPAAHDNRTGFRVVLSFYLL